MDDIRETGQTRQGGIHCLTIIGQIEGHQLLPDIGGLGFPPGLHHLPQVLIVVQGPQLKLLPDDAIIINVGRGSVIDQSSLEKELRNGRLFAGLDVFEQEPPEKDDPLWELPNLLITPHMAGNMTLAYTVNRIVELFLEDFENYCAGRPLARQVDLKRGY